MRISSPIPSASAPPLPPSPITTTTSGVLSFAISSRFRAIASDWPRSSAPIPGKAPGVSMTVITGRRNFSASFISRSALRYPSGCAIPKFRRIFSVVFLPFCCPMSITFSESSSANPATRDGSSRNSLSPWISRKFLKQRFT